MFLVRRVSLRYRRPMPCRLLLQPVQASVVGTTDHVWCDAKPDRQRRERKTLTTPVKFPEVGTRFHDVPAQESRLALCENVVGLQLVQLAVDRAEFLRTRMMTEPSCAPEDRHDPLEHARLICGRAVCSATVPGEGLGMGPEREPGGRCAQPEFVVLAPVQGFIEPPIAS